MDFFTAQMPKGPSWESIRKLRNQLLTQSDWALFVDSPLNNEQKQQWITYRKALRELPQSFSSPSSVVWPVKPS